LVKPLTYIHKLDLFTKCVISATKKYRKFFEIRERRCLLH
jgi:hypothetical protein